MLPPVMWSLSPSYSALLGWPGLKILYRPCASAHIVVPVDILGSVPFGYLILGVALIFVVIDVRCVDHWLVAPSDGLQASISGIGAQFWVPYW